MSGRRSSSGSVSGAVDSSPQPASESTLSATTSSSLTRPVSLMTGRRTATGSRGVTLQQLALQPISDTSLRALAQANGADESELEAYTPAARLSMMASAQAGAGDSGRDSPAPGTDDRAPSTAGIQVEDATEKLLNSLADVTCDDVASKAKDLAVLQRMNVLMTERYRGVVHQATAAADAAAPLSAGIGRFQQCVEQLEAVESYLDALGETVARLDLYTLDLAARFRETDRLTSFLNTDRG